MMPTNSTATDADMRASDVMLAFAPPVAHDTPIPWCPTCQQAHRIDARSRRLCLRHRYVRTLVRRLNDALIDGSLPAVDDIVLQVALPTCLRDGGDDERATCAWGAPVCRRIAIFCAASSSRASSIPGALCRGWLVLWPTIAPRAHSSVLSIWRRYG